MDTREDRRARAVPELAKLVRSRDFRTSLTKVAGTPQAHTIIVVLPDDTMGYVFDRLREAGSVGALALLEGERLSKIAILWPATPARVAVAEEDDNLAQIHRDSHVSMVFDYLERVHTAVIQCVAAQLVDQADLVPVLKPRGAA